MSAPAAIQAQLVDVRNVSSHKCVRLEIHVPAEQAGDVMAAFGWPTMADPVPVALARLVEDARVKPEQVKEHRSFSDLPLAQQAALRCQETQFQEFLVGTNRLCLLNATKDDVADVVRQLCGVQSRADIGKGPNDRSTNDSGFKWRALDAEYYAWQRGRR
jgi:hypothetical protein